MLRQPQRKAAGHERLHGVTGMGVGHGVHGSGLLVDMVSVLVSDLWRLVDLRATD